MTLPNFLVIGEAKAGTTSLHQHLRSHPEVFVSAVKELNYFVWDGEPTGGAPKRLTKPHLFPIHTWAEYEAQFAGRRHEKAVGEVSPRYLSHPEAAARIREALPDARLIAILRDPVQRAYSNWLAMVRDGAERRTFADAVRDEEAGRNAEFPSAMWHYVERGFHARHLRRYFDRFPREQIAVYLYDDLIADPAGMLRDLYRFLAVDSSVTPDLTTRRNVSGIPKSRLYQRLFWNSAWKRRLAPKIPPVLFARLKALSQRLQRPNLARPEIPADVRRELCLRYRTDVSELQELIDRDLSHWLAAPPEPDEGGGA